jgi:uncharacterized membrane protein
MSGKVVVGGLLLAIVVGLASPILGLVAFVALLAALFLQPEKPSEPNAKADPQEPGRLGDLERRVLSLEAEVSRLRSLVAGAATFDAPLRPQPAPPPPSPAPGPTAAAPRQAPPRPRPQMPPRPARPRKPRREIDLSKLAGALGLAWAGGIVTVLGVVFLFVLAVNRGWISPELRLAFGGAASLAVFAGGFWLRRRFGTTYAALAAVGAGIAGGFATLLAATALYGFISEPAALAAAAVIAAGATAVAVAWRSELVAALGLVGATLVPLMTVAEDDELTFVGTGFAALLLAATAAVSIRQGWRYLLYAGLLAALPQSIGLVAQSEPTDWPVVWLTAVYAALLVGISVAVQLGRADRRIESFAATLLLVSAALAAASTAHLFDGKVGGVSREGIVLGVIAAAYLALGAVFFRRVRDYSSLLWAVGLTVGAVSVGELLSGAWLAIAWAGEAAILAWLADTTRERRFQLASAAYLGLALAYTLGHDAEPRALFEAATHPAAGVGSILAVAAGAGIVGRLLGRPVERAKGEGPIASFVSDIVEGIQAARVAFFWLAGAMLAYAASFGLLELWTAVSNDPEAGFERGQVALSAFWAVLALALVETGGRLRRLDLSIAGMALAGTAILKTATFDSEELVVNRWALAFLLVGAATLLAGFEYQRLDVGRWKFLRPETAATALAVAAMGYVAVFQLGSGTWHAIDVEGGSLVLMSLVYAALAGSVFRVERMRDLSTLHWAIALTIVGTALFLLLEGVWLVLALTLASAALSLLAVVAREIRFQFASALFLLVAAGHTLVLEAPPRDFVVAAEHPGNGIPSLVLVVLAAVAFGLCARHEVPAERPRFSWSEPITLDGFLGELRSWQAAYRAIAFAAAGILGLYALSLGVLELAELVSQASVGTDFQRGHTAVSAVWGAIGLVLLTLGLVVRSRAVRLAGFALFGISLAKLFLYDLAYLSSLARSLSFLAVGALLLLGGFFYQRLSDQLASSGPPGTRAA